MANDRPPISRFGEWYDKRRDDYKIAAKLVLVLISAGVLLATVPALKLFFA